VLSNGAPFLLEATLTVRVGLRSMDEPRRDPGTQLHTSQQFSAGFEWTGNPLKRFRAGFADVYDSNERAVRDLPWSSKQWCTSKCAR
jgi:hypothetical protein